MESIVKNLKMNAANYYALLYMKRRGTAKSQYPTVMSEALKSWLTLSESEKQMFTENLCECRKKYKERFTNQLKTASPFMKKKINNKLDSEDTTIKNRQKSELIPKDPPDVLIDIEANETSHTPDNGHLDDSASPSRIDPDLPTMQCNEESTTSFPPNNEELEVSPDVTIPPRIVLQEPAPPTILTAKDLFEMTAGTASQERESEWKALSDTQKSRYRRSVLYLKKKYIYDYKCYLESLPPIELYKYYKNKKA